MLQVFVVDLIKARCIRIYLKFRFFLICINFFQKKDYITNFRWHFLNENLLIKIKMRFHPLKILISRPRRSSNSLIKYPYHVSFAAISFKLSVSSAPAAIDVSLTLCCILWSKNIWPKFQF